jgi:hypothetical protein
MVLCPFIFLMTSPDVPLLKLQPTEVASTHWVSLRALLSPSLRTIEYVDVSERLASQGGFITRSLFRSVAGKMMFSAIRLTPTESLQCSSIPTFVPGEQRSSRKKTLIEKAKAWYIGDQANSPDASRPLLLWGLTLGVLADFLDMIPPNNAVELWDYPTFTAPDLRLILWLMTNRLRARNLRKLNKRGTPNQTAMDGETVALASYHESAEGHYTPHEVGIGGLGVGRHYGDDKQGTSSVSYAVGIMLDGYYNRVRRALALFLLMRLTLGSAAAFALIKWFRRG